MKLQLRVWVLVWFFLFIGFQNLAAQPEELKGNLSLSGAWAVYPTAVAWAEAFQALHPKVKVDVSAGGAGKGAADAIAGLVDIGMVSRDPDPAEIAQGITPLYILHDAVYPVVSEKNPLLPELLKRGIKPETLEEIYLTGTITSWTQVGGGKGKKPLHVYTRSDSCGAAATWAKFLGKKQEDLKGISVFGDPGILDVVIKDPLGLGYSNFSYVFTREGGVLKGIKLLPIDVNKNGLADPEEVYPNRQAAIKALESQKYPVKRKNYFFIKGKAQGLLKEFLKFILSEPGTEIVNQVGTSLPLNKPEREKLLKSL